MYQTKTLGEVGRIITGYTPSKENKKFWCGKTLFVKPPHLKGGNIVTFTEETLSDLGKEKGKLIKKNSIMVCCIGSLGKVGIAGEDLCTNQQINSIYFDEKLVDFKYGYYFCITLEKVMNLMANKSIVAIINKSIFSTIKIPLPPLPTQKLIVQKLDSSFENINKQIDLIKTNLSSLEELNKSVLEKVFSEGEYEKIDLIKIANFSNKTILPKDGDLYNYVGLENIESHTGKLINFTETLGKEIRSNKVIFNKGMVLYGKLRPYLNKVLVSDFDGVATTEILPIECTDKLYNYYLGYFLRTDYFVNLANINISGARMPRVTTKFLKEEIQIPLPPLQKQKEIVAYLDQVFEKNKELKTKYDEQLKQLEELKQSLLKDAFEGRLVKDM